MSDSPAPPKRKRGRPPKSPRQAKLIAAIPDEPLQRQFIPRLSLPAAKGIGDSLSDELVAWIADQLRTRRVPLKFIAGALGITPTTLGRWMKQGEQDVEAGLLTRHSVLFVEVQRAQFEFVATEMDALRTAGPKEWVKHAWVLERCFQDTFVVRKETGNADPAVKTLGEMFAERLNAQEARSTGPLIIDVEPMRSNDGGEADGRIQTGD